MNKKLTRWLVLPLLLLLAAPITALAVADESSGNVFLAATETVNDNYVVFGNTITIDGTVNGDVVAFGNYVTVTGIVAGDVLVAGNEVRITGQVAGNVRAAGANVTVGGTIGKNVTVAGAQVRTESNTIIGWSFTGAGAAVDARGKIAGNANAYGANVTYGAEAGGNVTLSASDDNSNDKTETLTLLPSAKIGKNFTYKYNKELTFDSSVNIVGQTNYQALEAKKGKNLWSNLGVGYFAGKLIKLFGLFVVGLVLIAILGKKLPAFLAQFDQAGAKTFGWGLVYLIVTPIIFVLLLVTIIGIHLAFIVIALYGVIWCLSQVLVGLWLGQKLLTALVKDKAKTINLIWPMILGIFILAVLTSVPLLGWAVSFLAVAWGFGAVVLGFKKILTE